MQNLSATEAPRQAIVLSINSDLLAQSRALNINLSETLEKALRQELTQAERLVWAKENKAAIEAYNNFVEEHGCFGDEFRAF